MAEAGDNQPVVIRKKKKGHGGHGHHGGAWKVAYADFVTAMMAFFLLLWLLSTTTEEQKKGIADYFSPVSVARDSQSGAGGMLGGETITSDGVMVSNRTPFGVTMTLPADEFSSSETTEELTEGEELARIAEYADADERPIDEQGRLAETTPGEQKRALADGEQPGTGRAELREPGAEGERRDVAVSEAELARLAERQAEEDFREAVEQLRQAVQSVPELANLADNLLVDRTSEGMRLQIVDQQGTSMFERGSAVPEAKTRQLFSLISQTLARLPNKIAIKGHTDAVPYRGDGGYTNWELSSDRALASRRALLEAGLESSRIADVVGKADTDPLVPEDPEAPQNRRISIILLTQPAVAAAPQGIDDEPLPAPEPAPTRAEAEAPAAPAGAAPAETPSSGAPAAPAEPAPALPSGDGLGLPARSEAQRAGGRTDLAER